MCDGPSIFFTLTDLFEGLQVKLQLVHIQLLAQNPKLLLIQLIQHFEKIFPFAKQHDPYIQEFFAFNPRHNPYYCIFI